jgi:cell wall-associated NlpC family hydrolase
MSFQYLNVPYMWGGQNYLGMDCSGFVLKTLHDSGLTLPDMTANGLYKYCLRNGKKSSSEREAILFFGTIDKIVHTAISLGIIDGQWLMIEAGGAGSNSLTLSREELAQRDARVRIKPVSSRKDLIASIKIPYTEVRNENY